MREILTGVVVIFAVTFIVTLGFQALAILFGFIDYSAATISAYIPPDPTFSHYYYIVRANLPKLAAASLFVSLIASFIYLIIAAQRRRFYEIPE